MLLLSSQRSFMPINRKGYLCVSEIGPPPPPPLKADAADDDTDDEDDGRVGIWKAPLPRGTARLKRGTYLYWTNVSSLRSIRLAATPQVATLIIKVVLCPNEVLAKAPGFGGALLVRRPTVSARRDQPFQRKAGSGRSDSTRKVPTQRGDVVNLSGAQLCFTKEQLLFWDEQLKYRAAINGKWATKFVQGDQLQNLFLSSQLFGG